jgi:hypothetical protein
VRLNNNAQPNPTVIEEAMDKDTATILEIADGTMSVGRIKRIAKALGVELELEQIGQVTREAGIPTPCRDPSGDPLRDRYPDYWSIFLEARTFWKRTRRYWGDEAAKSLKAVIEEADVNEWRGLASQFEQYATSAILNRRDLCCPGIEIPEPLELEQIYPWGLQRNLYVKAFDREFLANPDPQEGERFPLATLAWREFKQKEYQENCLKAFDLRIGTEKEMIAFFVDFWKMVKRNRGDIYFQNLKHALTGTPDQPLSQRPFYSATEIHFRHWLRNLDGFKRKAPWRIPLLEPDLPLPMVMEGALSKHGWRQVEMMAVIALLHC